MAFRIHKGIFQNLNAEGTAYENAFKVDRDGVMKTVSSDGTVGAAFMKIGDKASDSNLLDSIDSGSFLRSDTNDTMSGSLTLKYSTADSDDYHAIRFAPDSNDYIIKASSSRGVFGRKSFGWHVDSNSAFGVYSNGWEKLFGVEGLTGNSFVKGTFTSNNLVTNQANIQSITSDGTIANDKGSYLHLGGWAVSRTHASAVLVNTAYRADYADSFFDMNISRMTNNSGYITQASVDALGEELSPQIEAAQSTADSKLDATAKAADSNLLDGLDSSEFARGRASYQVLNLDSFKQPGLYQYDGGISGGQPEGINQANLRTIEIGTQNRYSQVAFDWASDQAWFRRHIDAGWQPWREFIHSGNINNQSVNYATSAGTAADSELIDGVDSSRIVHGGNATKTTNISSVNTALASGFYDGYQITGTPTNTWYTYINMRHNNTNNNYGSQIAVSFYSNADMYVRTINNGTYQGWSKIWNEANFDPATKEAAGAAATAEGNAKAYTDTRIDEQVLPAIGDITLASLGFTGATNANYITNNNQLTNGAGYLTSSNDRVYITDSRGAARAPSYYNDRYAQWDFQHNSDTGAGGDSWHALLTVSKWSSFNSSHRQEQLIFTGDNLKRRTATSDSAWGTTKTIWDSGNFDPATKEAAGAAATAESNAKAYTDQKIEDEVLPSIPTNNNQLTNGAGYITGYSETSTLDAVADRGRTTNQQLISTNTSGFRVDSGSGARIEIDSNNNWSYLRLMDNGAVCWDIATFDNGSLEWRPGGGDANRMTLSKTGNLSVNGTIVASGDITAFSDARIKENVETLPNALESVKQMRGVTYNKIGEEKQSIGVIAQELEKVVPQLVHTDEEGMKSVAYGNITALLIEALKEQQKQIEELKAQIDAITK
jgi:hypothetical protein